MLASSVSYAQKISDLLPGSIGDYTRSDSARMYSGDELYNLIDGGADIFKEYGFHRVVAQRYSDIRDNYIDVELYEMKDSCSAYGVFSLITRNTGRRVVDFPGEAYVGDGFLLLWNGKYYASLTMSDPSGDSGLVVGTREMARRIPGSGKPRLVSVFDRMRSKESHSMKVAYIKGSLGFYNLSTISFGDDLKFREGVWLSTNGVRSFVLAYDSEHQCRDEYFVSINHVKSSTDWKPVKPGRDSCLFEGQGGYLRILRLGDYLLVSTSKDRAILEEMTEQISKVLIRG